MTTAPNFMTLQELAAYIRDRCRVDGDCLLWMGAVNQRGTPVFRMKCCGTRDPRRVYWEASGRELKHGHVFLKPACDERCLEPAHQHHVTRRRSAQIAAKQGRMSCGAAHALAIRNAIRSKPHVILSEEIAAKLRERYAEIGNAAQVAREFGYSHSLVHRVVRNQSWRATTPFSGLA